MEVASVAKVVDVVGLADPYIVFEIGAAVFGMIVGAGSAHYWFS